MITGTYPNSEKCITAAYLLEWAQQVHKLWVEHHDDDIQSIKHQQGYTFVHFDYAVPGEDYEQYDGYAVVETVSEHRAPVEQ